MTEIGPCSTCGLPVTTEKATITITEDGKAATLYHFTCYTKKVSSVPQETLHAPSSPKKSWRDE